MKRIVFFICLLFPLCVYPHKLTVIFTGNSQASLYPCGKCPSSVGGGVTRRATMVAAIKKGNALLIDGGNFTAGGRFDDLSINAELDGKRSVIYYQTMDKMGYDVVGVGQEELGFGNEFLREAINNVSFKFVSANVNVEGVSSYYVKEFEAFKVGVIGLSPYSISEKTDLTIDNYESSLDKIIKELNSKVDFIILVSAIGDKENFQLAEKFSQIKLILSSGDTTEPYPYREAGNAIVVNPSFTAKALQILDLDVSENNILNWEYREERLPLEVVEHPDIKSMIPPCFHGRDCRMKEGFVAKCHDSGEMSAYCDYYFPQEVTVKVITDKKCAFCNVKGGKANVSDVFAQVNFVEFDYREKEAKKFIKEYKINTLPCFIFPSNIKKERFFAEIEGMFEEREDKLFLLKEFTGTFLLLNNKKIPRKLDLFLNLYNKDAAVNLKEVMAFSRENRINLNVRFVVPEDKGLRYIEDEVRIAQAVKQAYPKKFLKYVTGRLNNIDNIYWIDSLEDVGIKYGRIKNVIKSAKVDKLIEEDSAVAEDLSIGAEGNVIFVNNNRIFTLFGVKKEELEQLFSQIE
jgi:hypothetical protein